MVRGEAHLVFRDITTGEITREQKQGNVITDYMLKQMINTSLQLGNPGTFGHYLFIGELDQLTDRSDENIYTPSAIGRVESGVTSPVLLSANIGTGGTLAYYYQYQQRFDPPATTRTIRVVGIGYSNISLPNFYVPVPCSAYLALASPCTQTPTETLDVFYRVIWDNPVQTNPDGLTQKQIDQLIYRHANTTTGTGITNSERGYPGHNYFFQHGQKLIGNTLNDVYTHGHRGYGSGFSSQVSNWYANGTYTPDYKYFARLLDFSIDLTQLLGRLVGTVGHAYVTTFDRTIFRSSLLKSTDSPIQNIFAHSSTATKPFYDSATVASGTGTLTINGDSWTNPDWNKLLRLDITGSGAVGVGTYKLSMRNTVGFLNNTYYDDHVAIPFLNNQNDFDENGGRMYFPMPTTDPMYPPYYAFTDRAGPMCMSYDDKKQVLFFTHEWVGRMDLTSGERKRWYATSTPSANFQDISQLYVDGSGDIWVADAVNGLFRISADGNTVTVFDNTHASLSGLTNNFCYGVTATPGKIWACFENTLAYTTDGGITFTLHDAGSAVVFTLPEAQRCWGIQGDINHADDRIAILYNDGATISVNAYIQIRWWDRVSGHGNTTGNVIQHNASTTLTAANPHRRRELFRFVSCSPNDGIWASRGRTNVQDGPCFWAYNGTTPSHEFTHMSGESVYNQIFGDWVKDIAGNDAYLAFNYNPSVTYKAQFRLCKQDLTEQWTGTIPISASSVQGASVEYFNTVTNVGIKCVLPESGMFIFANTNANGVGANQWHMVIPITEYDSTDGGEFHNLIWTDYGWDGANWVEGNTNSKTIHATTDALVDGLTVSWDDNTGTQTFVSSDYYTTGVVDGVLVDGGVEFNHQYALYYKNVLFNQTDVEGGGVLPATTRTYKRDLISTEYSNLLDITGSMFYTDSTRKITATSTPWGCRLDTVAEDYVYMEYTTDVTSYTNGQYFVGGLAVGTKAGTLVDANNIDYGVKVSHTPFYNITVEIIENGVVTATVFDGSGGAVNYDKEVNYSNIEQMPIRLERLAGTTDLLVKFRGNIVHTFTGVSGDLLPSFYGSYANLYPQNMDVISSGTDYCIELGDSGTTKGYFHPDFYSIDGTTSGQPTASQVKIDGTPVSTLLIEDDGRTVLATGEVDLITRSGLIRYSAADIGKTLTIDRYNVILHK